MGYFDLVMEMLGDDVTPSEVAPEAETTQQKASRLVENVGAPQQEPTPELVGMRDTQASSLPDPSSQLRLKSKLRDMLARRG